MTVGTEPAHWPQPRAGSEDATLAWLDALAGGICTPEVFLGAMRDQLQVRREEGWEVLSLLDQYYRRGRIKAEVFRSLKISLEDMAINRQDAAPTAQVRATAKTTPVAPAQTNAQVQATAAPAAPPAPSSAPAPRAAAPARASAPAQASAATQTTAQLHATARVQAATAVTAPARETRTAPAAVPELKVAPIARPAAREVAVGDVLRGRYRVRGIVGHGGMGTVFEATDEYRVDLPTTGRRLAVKVLHTAVTQREELLSELKSEFQHLQLLSHPNIVRVHEFDRDGDVAFFTMELLSGALLGQVLQARNAVALPRPYALAVIRDVGAAVSHAHSRGVVHGDINPQNIFITHDGEVRVLDFGASHKLLPDRWAAANAAALRPPVATPGYASCQLLDGQQPDARDDLFAFACVTYLLLSGQHPFPKRTALEARAQRMRPRRPPGLTGQQWRVLREGLRWDRDRRPPSVQEWLGRFGLSEAARSLPALPVLVNTPPPRKRTLLRTATAIILLGLLAAGGYWAYTNQDLLARSFAQWRAAAPEPASPALPAAPAASMSPAPLQVTDSPPPAANAPTRATPPPVTSVPTRVAAAPAPSPAAGAAMRATPATAPVREAAHAPTAVPVHVELAADAVEVDSGEPAAHVVVRRKGNLHGEASFKWWTESGTAKPGVDFAPVMPHEANIADGSGNLTLDIPVSPARRNPAKSFYVVIDQSDSGATMTGRTLTMVTLLPRE